MFQIKVVDPVEIHNFCFGHVLKFSFFAKVDAKSMIFNGFLGH